MKISHAIEKLCSFAIMKPKICKFRRNGKLEFEAPLRIPKCKIKNAKCKIKNAKCRIMEWTKAHIF